MTSESRIRANRLNAKKSTGPKTEEGKATSSKNALRHGLLAAETILPWESMASMDDLKNHLFAALKPIGELELLLADRIVSLTWRLRRAGRIESGIFAWRRYSLLFEGALADFRSCSIPENFPVERMVFPSTVNDQGRHKGAAEKLAETSALVNSELPALGRAFAGDAPVFAILQRYEVGLERSLFRTLNELRHLQSLRIDNPLASPIGKESPGE